MAAIALFSVVAVSNAPSPLYPGYAQALGLSATEQGTLFFSYSLGVIATLVVTGLLGDRPGDRRLPLTIGLLAVISGAFAMMAYSNFAMLLIGRLVVGIGAGYITGAASAALLDLFETAGGNGHHRAAIVSTMAFTLGAAIGPSITGLALAFDFYPEQFAFVAVAILAICALIGLLFASPLPTPAFRRPDAQAPDTPVRFPLIGLIVLSGGAIASSWAVIGTYMALGPAFAPLVFRFNDQSVVAYVLGLIHLMAGAAQMLSRGISAKHAFVWGLGLQVAGAALVAVAATVGTIWPLWPGIALASLGYGATFVGSTSLINRFAPPSRRSFAISIYYLIAYSANIASVLVGLASGLFGAVHAIQGEAVIVCCVMSMLAIFGIIRIPTTEFGGSPIAGTAQPRRRR